MPDFGLGRILGAAAMFLMVARMVQGYRAYRHRKAREKAQEQAALARRKP